MTDSNYTHMLVVVDRSGSMANIQNDMVGGLDQLFQSQKEVPGKCLVDYVQFDDRFERAFEDRDVADAKATLEPRGLTALVDAIGRSVTDFGAKLAGMDEDQRPGTVIVVVVTDGMENASQEWTADKVKALVQEQTDKYDWKFTFLGANMDAVKTGAMYGFPKGSSLTWNTDKVGAATATIGSYVTHTRSGLVYSYTDEDREANA